MVLKEEHDVLDQMLSTDDRVVYLYVKNAKESIKDNILDSMYEIEDEINATEDYMSDYDLSDSEYRDAMKILRELEAEYNAFYEKLRSLASQWYISQNY